MTARAFLAVAGGDPALVPAKVDGFRKLVLAWGAARSWLWWAHGGAAIDPATLALAAAGLTVCAALAWLPGRAHWAPRLALVFLLLELVPSFPLWDNHFCLEVVMVALLSFVGADDAGAEEVLQGIVWVTAIVLFHTGLQKVLHGLYFRGEFLAFMIGRGGRFRDAFAWLVSADDAARLAGYDPLRSGQGPYRVSSVPLVILSNLIWLAEMGLAPLLLWRRTRAVAAFLALALVLAIQLGARELGFALLFGNLLLLFFDRDLVRPLVPAFVALLLWAVLASLGILPGGGWIDPGYL